MVTGRFAIGSPMFRVKNWFDSAVKSSGAVSPAMRASASRTPVTTPARAAFSVTRRIMTHFGAPSAKVASRSAFGNQRQHVLGRADHDRDHDQRQRDDARDRRKTSASAPR